MERKFYSDNFERFLKGHADNFKMTPSKKVWRGIYNDVHPGKRGPSIAMSMLFVFTLVIIGHLNTNNSSTLLSAPSVLNSTNKITQALSIYKRPVRLLTLNKQNVYIDIIAENVSIAIVSANSQETVSSDEKYLNENVNNNQDDFKNLSGSVENNKIGTAADNTQNDEESSNQNNIAELATDEKNNVPIVKTTNTLTTNTAQDQNSTSAAATIKINKKNTVEWSYYASPTLSYRKFNGNSSQLNSAVIHKPTFGIEAGTFMSFKISGQLQGTSGLQVNYSGYNIKANNVHPVLATLMLNTSTPGIMEPHSAVSSFGNGSGFNTAKLKNYSVYASIPIGLQYTIGVGDNIQLNAAATLQPTFLIAGKAYLLSTDKKNYIGENSLLRTWNMGTNFGTFVSFKSNSYNWQIGPQINYQIFSSYTNRSPYNEHLINYGVRFGISKSK